MARGTNTDAREQPLTSLVNEAQAAVSSSANVLRDVRERFRTAYLAEVARWELLRSEVSELAETDEATAVAAESDAGNGTGPAATDGAGSKAARKRTRVRDDRAVALRREEAMAGREVGDERSRIARIELAIKSLENAWLFLSSDDDSLVTDPSGPASAADAQMRIIEAQEAERSRLAREVHDGPAQALANGIFQIEVIERLLDRDERLARAELRQLRDMLTRELRGVRAYLSQLRPPLLADLGLGGAIQEAADQVGSVLGVPMDVAIDDGVDGLPESTQVVVLRVVQEALQNVRKHAKPQTVRIRVSREKKAWSVEVRDDGKGFSPEAAPVAGRRNFGLQFMRERANLIGARFEVRSRPDLGTVVRMVIPAQTEEAS
jgi:two-component system sensor histidine kinase DegS